MFTKNEENKLILKIENVSYEFLNIDDYKKLVLYLTDPNIKLDINLQIATELQPEDSAICEKYKDFINKYIVSRISTEGEIRPVEVPDEQDEQNTAE
jgi:hypothetical protein